MLRVQLYKQFIFYIAEYARANVSRKLRYNNYNLLQSAK